MCTEIGLDSFDELERYNEVISSKDLTYKEKFHEKVCAIVVGEYRFQRTATHCKNLSDTEERVHKVSYNHRVKPMESGGSVEVKLEAKWGGKEGPSVNIGASGEVHDDRGNYAKGEIKQDSSGEGSTSVSAGHKEEKGPR